jgi:hypothetical protein
MSQDEATSWLEKAKGDLDVVRRSLMPLPDKNLSIPERRWKRP